MNCGRSDVTLYNVNTVDVISHFRWRCGFLQKKNAPVGEKPEPVRTHLRDAVVLPEMIGSIVGVYNGKTFNQIEIKVRCSGFFCARSRDPSGPCLIRGSGLFRL
jgi:hypothetical protein